MCVCKHVDQGQRCLVLLGISVAHKTCLTCKESGNMLLNNNGYQVAWLHLAFYARGSLSRCRGKELLKPTIPEVASPGDSFLVFFELSQVNSLAGCFLVLQEEEGACISVNARLAYTFHARGSLSHCRGKECC